MTNILSISIKFLKQIYKSPKGLGILFKKYFFVFYFFSFVNEICSKIEQKMRLELKYRQLQQLSIEKQKYLLTHFKI